MNRALKIGRIGLLVFGVAAVPFLSGMKSVSGMLEMDSVSNATEELVFRHSLPAGKNGTELSLKSNLSGGTAVWKVRNSAGQVVWEEKFRKGSLTKVQRLEGSPGAWSVEVSFQGATGRYRIKLKDF